MSSSVYCLYFWLFLATVESGVLSDTQKEELIKRLTEISSEIMKIPQEFFVTTIKEVPDKNFGIGGKTIDKVKAEYMQYPPCDFVP